MRHVPSKESEHLAAPSSEVQLLGDVQVGAMMWKQKDSSMISQGQKSSSIRSSWISNSMLLSLALFIVIATQNFLAFFELAGSRVIFKIIFSIVAVTLDLSKIVLLVTSVRQRNVVFLIIAICLGCISLMSGVGSSFMIVEGDSRRMEA